MLSAQQLRDKEPHALPHLLGAVSMPRAASVNPRKLMLALLAEVSKFEVSKQESEVSKQESGDAPPGAGDGGGSGEGGKTRGRLQMFWGHTVAGVSDDASGAGRWSRVSIRPNGGLRASVALLLGRTASSIFGGEVMLSTRATVLAVGPHSQLLAKRLLSTHVPIMPVVGTMLRLEGPKDHAQVLNHILLSHESTLFFEKERAHQDALRLSNYRAMPARRGEHPKGGTPFSAHDKELWKTLKEEGQPIPGRPEVFEWRGRVLLQPRQDDVGRLVVEEEGTGEVILRTEGTKPAAQGWPGAGRGQTHKMPVDHLERLVCPPGATHALGALSNQRRTRHLYGKQAADKSLWFGGDRIGATWWAPWLWRGGVSAPPHSTLSVRQHVSSILKLPESFVTVRTWQGVMAFSTVQILKRTHTPLQRLYMVNVPEQSLVRVSVRMASRISGSCRARVHAMFTFSLHSRARACHVPSRPALSSRSSWQQADVWIETTHLAPTPRCVCWNWSESWPAPCRRGSEESCLRESSTQNCSAAMCPHSAH